MKRYIYLLLPVFLLVTGCTSNSPATPLPTVEINSQPQVTVSVSTTRPTGGGVSASGKVVPLQDAQLGFTLGGTLKAVNFKVGDVVSTGQILAELDNNTYKLDLEQAELNLKELTSAASQAAAEQALAVAQQNLKDQQDKVDSQFYRRASDTLIDKTQGEIDLAKQTLARAADAYRLVARLEDGDSRKAAALVAMTNAQLNLNNLLAKYNWYSGKPSEIDAALANARLDVAKAAVQEAGWYLAAIKGDPIPAEATGSGLSALNAAKVSVATARDRLAHTQIVSPIPGVVVKAVGVPGEFVSPGEVIFLISDITKLHIETTDLSERDVPNVHVGQKVSVIIKALNKNASGVVTGISPVADLLGGDVVYKTWIDFDTMPEGLLAGMSVDVEYEAGQ